MDKLRTRDQIILVRQQAKTFKKTVGFISGSFDLLHALHIETLQNAKKECDILIVGLNTDNSVKGYKDKRRPIIHQSDRATILCALECVDYVFLFDELNNNINIELIQPDFYIKGMDYKNKPITSKSLVESYGGKVILVPPESGINTTDIITDILSKELTTELSDKHQYNGIVFLDRDGVINEEKNYLYKPEEFELLPGVLEAIKIFNDLNLAVVVVTNQPGISLGLYTKEDFYEVNKKMIGLIHKNHLRIDRVVFCPDYYNSKYKKPESGMLSETIKLFNPKEDYKCFMVGDQVSDLIAGKQENCRTIAVKTGKNLSDEVKYDFFQELQDMLVNYHVDNILEAALKIKELVYLEENKKLIELWDSI